MKLRRWTEQERAYIAAHYGEMPTKVIAMRLGRTAAAVWGYAEKHGLSYQRWTDAERQYVREHYKDGDVLVAAHLGRSAAAVERQRALLGLTRHCAPRRAWTQEDDDYLRAHFPDEPTAVVARALGRTRAATSEHAVKLAVRKSDAYMDALTARRRTECKTHANPAKVSATLRRTYRLERARVMHGLPQKTRLRISFETSKKRNYIANMRRHGYILSADRHTLYYTAATDRSPKAERGAARFHMTIVEKEGE